MRISRHRITRLLELSALERTLTGPERMLREQDVAQLIKAAYDEATEPARAEFMARVQPMPTSAWPWSAVQAMAPRGGGGGGIGVIVPKPLAVAPAALILIRGQAESADASPGDTLPARGSLEGAEWEPLYRALDAWDTATIARWIGPQVWMNPTGASPGGASGTSPDGSTSGPPAGGVVPTQPVPVDPPAPLWGSPVVVATGAVAVVATGVAIYALARSGDVKRLEGRINAAQRQEAER
jgi:hypothetical protein